MSDPKDDRHPTPEARPDDLGFELPPPATLTPARAVVFGLIVAIIVGGAFLSGWLPRKSARAALEAETHAADIGALRVQVLTPKVGASDRSMTIPGSVQPLEETVIYPRASGYVRSWAFDIGDKVKTGDLLAEIDTPEIDQELVQAKAQLAQAEASVLQASANDAFSKQNLDRYKRLTPAGVASQQELEQKAAQAQVDEANVAVAKANSEAQRANIQRLMRLKSFARVQAPFAGTVTWRSVERGALVTAGNATPLFKIANLDPMRVFVQLPQDVASGVKVDVPAQVTLRELAGKVFEGKVAHTAGALDSVTRTMTTEIRVPNPKGELMGGMYAQVALTLPTPHRVFAIPGTAVIDDGKGVRVATVTADGRIHLVPITVERDTGASIEVATGIDETTRVVKLVSPEITEGRVVEVVP
jgi:membrane fusion protein, multidrug efflux system